MSTIYDIAKETGYSPSTVARVLRGRGYASPDARRVIEAAVARMNYTPSYAAKVMRTKNTRRILFCVPELDTQFYYRINQKICTVLDASGYFCLISVTGRSEEKELQMVGMLHGDIADGMIMVAHNVTPQLKEAINGLSKPVVLINWVPDKSAEDRFHNIYTDMTDGVYKTTKLLIDHGHQRIAFVVGNLAVTTVRSRYLGYVRALEHSGIPFDNSLVYQISEFASISSVYDSILSRKERPTAVVFTSDDQAAQFMSVCRQHNLNVPDDISVTGMNDERVACFLDPPLTTYFLNDGKMGELAAQMMLDSLNDRIHEFQTIRMEGELIYRNSVAKKRE